MKPPRTTSLALLVSLLFAAGGPASAAQYRCDVNEKFVCAPKEGCRASSPTVWNFIDTEASTYSRCDRNGCDSYPLKMERSGAFMNIDLPSRGTIAKMAVDGSAFVESATLGTQVHTSFGTCHQQLGTPRNHLLQ